MPTSARHLALHIASNAAWSLSGHTLRLLAAGFGWRTLDVPRDVRSTNLVSVQGTANGSVLLAVYRHGVIQIFRKATTSSPWSSVRLRPDWRNGTALQASRSVVVTMSESRPGVLTVTMERQVMSDALEEAFVSTDSGRTFHTRPASYSPQWHVLAALSPADAVAIVGPGANRIDYTVDGGASWTPSVVADWGTQPDVEFSSIFRLTEGRVGLAGSQDEDTGTVVRTFTSSDHGAHFTRVSSSALTIPPSAGGGDAVMTSYGEQIWVVSNSGSSVYRSDDGGLTWRHVVAHGLALGASAIAVSGGADAAVNATTASCKTKMSCTSVSGSYVTSDGGATWHLVP